MMKANIKEEWKPIVGYEGLYAVSSLGNVKSVERTRKGISGSTCRVRERILKPQKNSRGYLNVGLSKNGKVKMYRVHRLVAQAYPEICGEWFEGAVCDHLDRDTTHNNALNIRVGTQKDNLNNPLTKKAMCEGRQKRTAKIDYKARTAKIDYKAIAEKNSKKVFQYTKSYELVGEYPSIHEVERQTGWSQGNISLCCNNRFNREGNNVYKGYIWSFTRL